MILDSLANSTLYRELGPRFEAAFEWLRGFDPASPDGRVDLHGDDLFALVQSYETTPGMEKRFETHRVYADVQFVAAGRERILHVGAAGLEVDTPYDAATDIAFYREPPAASSLLLGPGDFAVLWPGDAHKPGCMAGGREAVRKVVLKVRL